MDERPARTQWTRSRLSGICPALCSTASPSSQQSVESAESRLQTGDNIKLHFRLWSHRPQDHVGPDRHHGVRRVRAAHLHALAEQCGHTAGPDIHIPLRKRLLLCL